MRRLQRARAIDLPKSAPNCPMDAAAVCILPGKSIENSKPAACAQQNTPHRRSTRCYHIHPLTSHSRSTRCPRIRLSHSWRRMNGHVATWHTDPAPDARRHPTRPNNRILRTSRANHRGALMRAVSCAPARLETRSEGPISKC